MFDRIDTTRPGHNNPPSPIEIARGTTTELSHWMADHPVIQTEDDAHTSKMMIDRARANLEEMEAERDALVRPLNEQVKAINDRYRPGRTTLEKLIDELKKRLSAYARALEIERVRKVEEARKAAEAAERAAREAEQREHEAIEEADHGVCDVDLGAATREADAAFAAFRKAERVAARAERDSHIRIAGGFGRAMGMRDREILTVTDWQAAISELGLTDTIRDAILTSARAYRKAFHELPEGVVATYDRSL
jgi:hypothetical protein